MNNLLSLLILMMAIFPSFSGAQTVLGERVDFKQNPNSISWKKIDSEHFEVIFPQEIEKQAQRATFLLERAYKYVSRSLEVLPKKISLILQNQSVISNGFVTLAPRRSEWFMTPSVDAELTNTDWLKTLAIHEFRHVVQFEKSRQNVNRYFEFFMGEIGQGLGLVFSFPPWFLEGDAVGIETALTNGGRGRLPRFERDLRTILLSDQNYDFDEVIHRSYKNWIPNHYVYGYFLTSYLRNHYGDLFLSDLADEATHHSWNPLSFYNALDDLTFGDFEEVYGKMTRELIKKWREELNKIEPTPFKVVHVENKKDWINYDHPMLAENGDIVALKSGFSYLPQFILIDSKQNEKKLFYPGPIVQESQLKMRKNRFSFLELEFDPRWGYRDYQRLRVFDLSKNDFIFDLKKTKFRTAVISHDGDKILALEWNESQEQKLAIIDLKDQSIRKINFPTLYNLTSLDWLNHLSAVAVIKNEEEQKKIIKIDLLSGDFTDLTSWEYSNLGSIFSDQHSVLVESPGSGIDNIFYLNNGKLVPITSSLFGAYSPVLYKDHLYFNDYGPSGMKIVKKELLWNSFEENKAQFYPVYEKFSSFEMKDAFSEDLKEVTKYNVQDYSEMGNALNLHSWMFIIPPLSNVISFMGFSQDILNKFQLSAGAQYNLNERAGSIFTGLSFSYYYPVFDLSASYGRRRQKIDNSNDEVSWEEGEVDFGVSVPWRNIYNQFIQDFTIRVFSKLLYATNRKVLNSSILSDETFFSPGVQSSFSWLKRTAPRDLYPLQGFKTQIHFEQGNEITSGSTRGNLLSIDQRFYHPSFFSHDVFFYQIGFEKQQAKDYQYASQLLLPRGSRNYFFKEFLKYSANYAFPVAYPDWSLERFFYLKRVFATSFYDYLDPKFSNIESISSVGWEVLFESYFFRLMLPITWGIRGSYLLTGPDKNEENYELFLSSTLAVF